MIELTVAGLLLVLTATFVTVFTRQALLRPVLRFGLGLPAARYAIGPAEEHRVRGEDGVGLSTRVVLPEGTGPWPVVIIRNPYDLFDAFSTTLCEGFAEAGFACVHQDVRGRMGSEGEWSPLVNERQDGLRLFEWLREQPFQDGRWAVWGASYLAATGWTVADSFPPEVKTMVSMVFAVDTPAVMYDGGLFRHDLFSVWAALMPGPDLAFGNGFRYRGFLRHRPHREADRAVLGVELPWYRDWLDAPPGARLWTEPPFTHFFAAPEKVDVPVLMVGGWYDPFMEAQVRDFRRLRTRDQSRLVIGPWNHLLLPAADLPLPGDLGVGEQWAMVEGWLQHHLTGAPLEQALGVVQAYVMGAGGFRRRFTLPPRAHDVLRLELAAGPDRCPGRLLAARSPTDGAELPEEAAELPEEAAELPAEAPELPEEAAEPRAEALGTWVHDPERPLAARGGAAAIGFAVPTFPGAEPGARAQDPPCGDPGLLSFVSAPLATPVTLAGRPVLELLARSSAEATAFGFELMVERPGTDRWFHVRDDYAADAAPAGAVRRIRLEAAPIEWRFPAGARLRVDLRSSNFPLLSVHPNRPGPWARVAADGPPATQTVLAGSSLRLPLRQDEEPVLSGPASTTVRPAMACQFDIELTSTPDDLVQKAQEMVHGAGGSFAGDTERGEIKVKLPVGAIEGTYVIESGSIRFQIDKKPMLVPCGTIETFIRDRLKS